MGFDVAADAYQRFMGRYADPLAKATIAALGVHAGQRVVDVGAGTGALTAPLVDLLGTDAVTAVDPSPAFAAALASRLPGVEVHKTGAESLPLPDGSVDLAVAQLVVNFMSHPARGISEMRRVLRDGGTLAVSVWDFATERAPLSLFWRAARELAPGIDDEAGSTGVGRGQLAALLRDGRLREVRECELTVTSAYTDAADWWEPYTLGVGPAGEYLAGLDADHREALRVRCVELLAELHGSGPLVIEATAWFASGVR